MLIYCFMLLPVHQMAFKILYLFSYIAQKSISECEADAVEVHMECFGCHYKSWLTGCCSLSADVSMFWYYNSSSQQSTYKFTEVESLHSSAGLVPFQFWGHLSFISKNVLLVSPGPVFTDTSFYWAAVKLNGTTCRFYFTLKRWSISGPKCNLIWTANKISIQHEKVNCQSREKKGWCV